MELTRFDGRESDRPESFLRGPSTRNRTELRLTARQLCESSSALMSNEGPQSFVNQRRSLLETGELARMREQGIIDIESGSHLGTLRMRMH